MAPAIDHQFEQSKCAEPEESLRLSARDLIAKALAAHDPGQTIQVEANGRQSGTYSDGEWNAPFTNYLKIEVKPIYQFVE